jgi:hemin uptake protein HemP
MGTRLTPEEVRQRQSKRDAQFSPLTPEEVAESDNAISAAEEIGRDGHTNRRCLACSGELIVEHVGASYLVRCAKENRVILTSRGI